MKQVLVFLPFALAGSVLFVSFLFRPLRRLNYREERVFDLVFLNLVSFWLVAYLRLIPLFLAFPIINALFIKKQLGWSLGASLSVLFRSYLLLLAFVAFGLVVAFSFPVYFLPLGVAFLLVCVLSSIADEAISRIGKEAFAKVKKARKRVAKK